MTAKALLQSAGDGTAVPAGRIGEIIFASLGNLSSTALTSTVAKTVTSITITPGVWFFVGGVNIQTTSGSPSVTEFNISTSKTNNTVASAQTVPSNGEVTMFYDASLSLAVANNYRQMPMLSYAYSTTSTETIYLVAQCVFSGGGIGANGYIQAIRIA